MDTRLDIDPVLFSLGVSDVKLRLFWFGEKQPWGRQTKHNRPHQHDQLLLHYSVGSTSLPPARLATRVTCAVASTRRGEERLVVALLVRFPFGSPMRYYQGTVASLGKHRRYLTRASCGVCCYDFSCAACGCCHITAIFSSLSPDPLSCVFWHGKRQESSSSDLNKPVKTPHTPTGILIVPSPPWAPGRGIFPAEQATLTI